MKKRKIKLFASVASLAMVAAVMGVGVWAATSQAIGVSSTVSFTGTNIDATITLAVEGKDAATAGMVNLPSAATWTFAAADSEVTTAAVEKKSVDLTLIDANTNGLIDATSTLKYTFTFSDFEGTIAYEITMGTNGNSEFEAAPTLTGTVTTAAPTIVITYTTATNIANITDANNQLDDIVIKLTQQPAS